MTDELSLPWAPLFTTYRSDLPEITVSGIAYVWAEDKTLYANAGRSLLRVGNTRNPLWTRSLLKPFQLMALYPVLKQSYPQLTTQHFAMMTASQSGEPAQLALLREILAIGELPEAQLQCGACRPMGGSNTDKSPLNHPCAGKHLAHLLYLKAIGQPLENYLSPEQEPYERLRILLDYLLSPDQLPESVDGCGMPNMALSPVEVAQLYQALIMPISKDLIRQAPDEIADCLSHWDEIPALFEQHPALIGGEKRLDSRLMNDTLSPDIRVISKEGADGMLALALGPNANFADGMGIFIKIASGYEPKQLEQIARQLLTELGLLNPVTTENTGVLETRFHFTISAPNPAAS